jgi:hypothetical protein
MEKCSARSNANTGAACFYLFKDPNAGLRMSALGQKQTLTFGSDYARFTSKADIGATQTDVRFVLIADSCSAA